jgi:hypothetical protein
MRGIEGKIILFIVIMLSLYAFYLLFKKSKPPVKPTSLSSELVEELYNMIKIFDRICRDHNIPYFIVGGTLLGSVREKKFIPHDDDIDIGMMEEHLEKLNRVDFAKYGLKCRDILTGKGKIFYIDRYDSNEYFESVWIDVFGYKRMGVYDPVKGEKIDYLFDGARKAWPNEYFWGKELFPLRSDYIFNDMMLVGPSSYIPYCERAWGTDWYIPKKK